MILLAAALTLIADSGKPVCIAWRDPNTGKIMNTLEVAERANKLRQQVFSNEASDRLAIENARKPVECALRKTDNKSSK